MRELSKIKKNSLSFYVSIAIGLPKNIQTLEQLSEICTFTIMAACEHNIMEDDAGKSPLSLSQIMELSELFDPVFDRFRHSIKGDAYQIYEATLANLFSLAMINTHDTDTILRLRSYVESLSPEESMPFGDHTTVVKVLNHVIDQKLHDLEYLEEVARGV